MSDSSVGILTYAGRFFSDDINIPGQARLLEVLGKRPDDASMDPETISKFQRLCVVYEEYLFVKVHEAISHVMANPTKYKSKRFVIVRVDLNKDGLFYENGELEMPFHLAHYGLMRKSQGDESTYWSRRDKRSWKNCGILLHPFQVVQQKLVEIGYHLVDMSYIGIGTHFRLYFRGPPTRDDYLAHLGDSCKVESTNFDPKSWFWHNHYVYTPFDK